MIYGTERPSGGYSIVADPVVVGGNIVEDGIISTYAGKIGSSAAACCRPDGLSVEPTGSTYTSRAPADARFNPASRPAIDNLHSTAWAAAVTNGTTLSGDVIVDCQPNTTTYTASANTSVTVNCPSGYNVKNNKTITFQGYTSVKFIGDVNVAGGGSLEVKNASTVTIPRGTSVTNARLVVGGIAAFDNVRNFYVGGTPTTCTQPRTTAPRSTCPARFGSTPVRSGRARVRQARAI